MSKPRIRKDTVNGGYYCYNPNSGPAYTRFGDTPEEAYNRHVKAREKGLLHKGPIPIRQVDMGYTGGGDYTNLPSELSKERKLYIGDIMRRVLEPSCRVLKEDLGTRLIKCWRNLW